MPTVPQYGGQQVETRVAQESRARPVAPGAFADPRAAQAESFGGVVQSAGRDLAEMQERVSIAAAQEALTSFEREKNQMFFDPEQGYFNTQGRDAYDRAGDTLKSLEKAQETYMKNLPTEAAKQAFRKSAQAHMTRAEQDVMRHASSGIRAWEVATTEAQVENAIENAAVYWNDDKQFKLQRARGRQAVIDAAALQGIDGEALNERLQNYESAFATQAVEAAAATSATEAERIYGEMKDRIEGPMQVKLQGAIAKAKEAEAEQEVAGLAVLKGTNLVSQFGDEPNARTMILEEVNKIDDPELRKKTHTEAMHQLDAKRKADSEARASVFEAGEQHLLQGLSVESFIAENPRAWKRLSAEQQRTLMQGPKVETDHVLLNDLMLMPKDQLAKISPTDYFHSLAPGDRTRLTNAVESARTGGTEAQTGRSVIAQTNAMVEQIFGEKKGWNDKKRQKANALYNLINDEVAYRESKKGAPLTSQEYTDLLNSMSRTVVKERQFWLDTEMDITDIPAEDMKTLSDYLHQNNIPATADNLIRAYQQAAEQ